MEEDFARRLRIINNLIQNSEDEISDSENRSSGNRMPAILAQVEYIIFEGKLNEELERNFSSVQIAEEIEKIEWLKNNSYKSQTLFLLEDHKLLYGQIGIIGINNSQYFKKFIKLFDCNYDKINCALMSIEFYGQKEQNGWRFQLGTKNNDNAWRNIFHKSRNSGFDTTQTTLIKLFTLCDEITDDNLDKFISDYIADCELMDLYDWRYYYIKYPSFRPSSHGKYRNTDTLTSPYMYSVMLTSSKLSESSYMPFLKEVDAHNISREYYGQRLSYNEYYIICENSSYVVKNNDNDAIIDNIPIAQNEKGIDIIDRIVLLKNYLAMKYDK